MPELPEVETVCIQLQQKLADQPKISEWVFRRHDLRFPIPKKQLTGVIGQSLQKIDRRAKYILIHLEKSLIIWHLGMTGAFRFRKPEEDFRKHDHINLKFNNGLELIYEDPRRFGFIKIIDSVEMQTFFKNLGPEPFLNRDEAMALTKVFKKLKCSIKVALLNQKHIVGIGNIYASEILFKAGVSPLKACSKVTLEQYLNIWTATAEILKQAIAHGGSTIQSYKNAQGKSGQFQKSHKVYGRLNEKCSRCSTLIRQKVQAGRSTFWCPGCQA